MTEAMSLMNDADETADEFCTETPVVYGPVKSWRVGSSLGIDLLCINSICSFRCFYCQLGRINVQTAERQLFVSTDKVLADLQKSKWQSADVITFSGNGEPTLALNLGETIHQVKTLTGKPVVVLTNSAHLNDPAVRRDLLEADKIFCKLDAATEKTFSLINRPVAGLTLQHIVEGIKQLRAEYLGWLAIQTMLMPVNAFEIEALAALYKDIQPDEVQLNTPLRPVPREWYVESRGHHDRSTERAARLRVIDRNEAAAIEKQLRELTRLRITSVYSRVEDEQ